MNKVRFNILGLGGSNSQLGSYSVILDEYKGEHRIPIIIKTNLAMSMLSIISPQSGEKIDTTYSFIENVIHALNGAVNEININDINEGIFDTTVTISSSLGEAIIDCKIGDALIIAMMHRSEIFINEEVVNRVGILINDNGEITTSEKEINHRDRGSYLDKVDLQDELEKAIANQDFEKAAEIHAQINK